MRNQRTDSGIYNRPAQIQAPATLVVSPTGGNSASGQWTTVRSPMIHIAPMSAYNAARSLRRGLHFAQQYPTASYWAEMRYASDVAIDATMTLLVDGRRYQILGALDVELEHVSTILALQEWQAEGSK